MMSDDLFHHLFRPSMIKASTQRRKLSRALSSRTSKIAKQTVLRSLAPRSKQKEKKREEQDDDALVDQELSLVPNHLLGLVPKPLDTINSMKDKSTSEVCAHLENLIFSSLKDNRRNIGLIYRPKLDCFCLMMNEHLYWLIRLSSTTMGSRHPEFLLNWISRSYSNLQFFLHAPSNKWGGLVFRVSVTEDGREILIFSTLFPRPDASLMRAYCSIECENVDGKTQLQLSYTKGRPDSPIIKLDGVGDVTRQTLRAAVSGAVDSSIMTDNWIIVESCSKHKFYTPGKVPPA